MNTRILAISGKLGAGKDSLSDFLIKNAVPLFGPRAMVHPFSLIGGVRDFLVDCLGLEPRQVWGNQQEKSTLTRINWQDLPHYPVLCREITEEVATAMLSPAYTSTELINTLNSKIPSGPMTGRQVMEQFVERILRPMSPDCVERQCLNNIRRSNATLAIITDLRMPTEFEAIKKIGGKIIRLTRTTPEARANTHISNVALDKDRFDWGKFDAVIDNQNMSLLASKVQLMTLLR